MFDTNKKLRTGIPIPVEVQNERMRDTYALRR